MYFDCVLILTHTHTHTEILLNKCVYVHRVFCTRLCVTCTVGYVCFFAVVVFIRHELLNAHKQNSLKPLCAEAINS